MQEPIAGAAVKLFVPRLRALEKAGMFPESLFPLSTVLAFELLVTGILLLAVAAR
jgi:hypothetical protein